MSEFIPFVVPEKRIAVSVPEAVRITGMSRSALYELMKRHEILAKKAGRRTLIPLAELQAYVASLPDFGTGE